MSKKTGAFTDRILMPSLTSIFETLINVKIIKILRSPTYTYIYVSLLPESHIAIIFNFRAEISYLTIVRLFAYSQVKINIVGRTDKLKL